MPVRPRTSKAASKPQKDAARDLNSKPTRGEKSLSGTRLVFALVCFLALIAGSRYWFSSHGEDSIKSERLDEPFVVAKLPGKGMGLIATRPIKRGQLLIREKPLFMVPSSITMAPTDLIWKLLQNIEPSGRAAFNNLSYVHFPDHLDPATHPQEVALAIFLTNAVAAGDEVGIFPRMARLNHGCSSAFNVVYNWRNRDQVLVVHALKDINPGEELLTTYTDTKRTRDERRSYLLQQYGFTCSCAVCSLPEAQSKESDRRLIELSNLYEEFSRWASRSISGSQATSIARRMWAIGDDEGYTSERGRLAADATWIAAAHSDSPAVQQWGRLAVEWYGYELGMDSEEVLQMNGYLRSPRSHPGFGTREVASVGGGPEANS